MHTTHCIRLCVLCVFAFGTFVCAHAESPKSAIPPKRKTARKVPKQRIAQCVAFRQQLGEDKRSVNLLLINRCSYPTVCQMRWLLNCSSAPVVEGGAEPSIDAKKRWKVTVSAAHCNERWEISEVHWSCVASK